MAPVTGHFSKRFLPHSRHRVPVEARHGVLSRAPPEVVVAERQRFADRGRQRLRVGACGDEPRVERLEQLGRRAGIRPDDRRATRERLQRDHSEALVGDGREYEQVGCPVPVAQLILGDSPHEPHAPVKPKLRAQADELVREEAPTDDGETKIVGGER